MRIVFFIGCIFFVLMGCKRTEAESAMLDQKDLGTPTKEAFNVKFIFSEDAVRQALLEAPHAIESKENGQDIRIFDRGMHLIFFTPSGERKSDLVADYGIFKNQFNDADLFGNVKMINEVGDHLDSDTLYWSKKENTIFSPTKVQIRTQTEQINGDSMRATADFTDYKIYHPVGAVQVKQEGL